MSFILATADFPDMDHEAFSIIFTRLQEQHWIKIHRHSRPANTLWYNTTIPAQPEEAIKTARHNFNACCVPICIPRLAIEWSAQYQPSFASR